MTDYAPAPIALLLQPTPAPLPGPVAAWLNAEPVDTIAVTTLDELMVYALRSRPRMIVIDGRRTPDESLPICARIKGDHYTGVIPLLFVARDGAESTAAALRAHADEVVSAGMDEREASARLVALLVRSDRDVTVHPSTRLPGAPAIQREIEARLRTAFAVCYADLDHFKEFNDRYSYVEGDRVIRLLATLLHDTVRGVCGDDGFVGHIGGDDFILIIPRSRVDDVCSEIVATFDTLVAYQYSEHDRRAGYFFGKDRRGQLHRVPLMTLSIGVVTNERRVFTSAAAVSGLATEMKTYAKTLPGSVYAIDRRIDDRTQPTSANAAAATTNETGAHR